jgi:glycerol-3-phosphate dehydrogenase (NAD(P)+)
MGASVLILGFGSFGRALFHVVRNRDVEVSVYSRTQALTGDETASCRQVFYETTDIDLTAFETVFVALPSYAVSEVFGAFSGDLSRPAYVSCSKGIDFTSGQFPSELIRGKTGCRRLLILSGPSFSAEIMEGKKSWVTLASDDLAAAREIQQWLSGDVLGVQTSSDPRGLELLGVGKNLIALGAGISDGLSLGENFRAALITAGINELHRILPELGGARESVLLFGGIGDVVLTAVSERSRNYRMGRIIGSRQPLQPLMSEGLFSATSFARFLVDKDVSSPFFANVARSITQPDHIHNAIAASA